MKFFLKTAVITTIINNYFEFKMALRKTLNATCNLDGYLFCRMPADTLEVEIKVKTKWGKYSMFQDTYTQHEKYCTWDRANRRSSVCTGRRRIPHREVVGSSHDDNTTSETDIPVGQGLRYPPQVFTDPKFAAEVPHTKEEEEVNNKFIGNYHKTCDKCSETRCWCNSSDWGEELIDIDNSTTNPTLEKTPSHKNGRKPPAGWVEHRGGPFKPQKKTRETY